MSFRAGANGLEYQSQAQSESAQSLNKRDGNQTFSHQQQKHFEEVLERRRREAAPPDAEHAPPAPVQSLFQISSVFETQSSRNIEPSVLHVDKKEAIQQIEAMVRDFWLRDPTFCAGTVSCRINFASGFVVPVSLTASSGDGVQIVLHVTPDAFAQQSGLDARDLFIFLQDRFPKRRICVDLTSKEQRNERDAD